MVSKPWPEGNGFVAKFLARVQRNWGRAGASGSIASRPLESLANLVYWAFKRRYSHDVYSEEIPLGKAEKRGALGFRADGTRGGGFAR
jgi:hypothetical protein